ncbi:MAG: hypothetical protein P1P88_20910 [Bacteroidales bacterium]|nr:hypothetical protein [Bacteroidales bacterium]
MNLIARLLVIALNGLGNFQECDFFCFSFMVDEVMVKEKSRLWKPAGKNGLLADALAEP